MALRAQLGRVWHDESGQTLVFGAVCLTVLIGFLGICIDVGHIRYAKSRLQSATDAAALAAGLELRVCGSNNPCAMMASAGQSALSENGYSASSAVYNCAAMPTGSLSISFNRPPCALGSGTDPNTGKQDYLEVQVQQPLAMFFARMVGWRTFLITARAEVRHAGAPCIYALDPSGSGAINVAAGLTTNCGIVDESTSSTAFTCQAGTVAAPQITMAGNTSGLLCSVNAALRAGAPMPVPADPLKSTPVPTIPACGTSLVSPFYGSAKPLLLAAGTYVLYPDKAYCGGITIQIGATVTFMPGTYVITGSSSLSTGLNIALGATVTGTNVTFYNSGPNGALSMTGTGSGNVKLVAPSSGTYSGLLYFQDAANTNAATMTASSSGTLVQGGFYLPTAKLTYAAAAPGPYTVLVAKDLAFTLSSLTLFSDFSSLTNGSPIVADNAQLVQ